MTNEFGRPARERLPEPASIRAGLYRLTPAGPSRVGLVRPDDELVFSVEVVTGGRPRKLIVEFWRGDRLRDRWGRRLNAGERLSLAFRLRWSVPRASSRLTCRIVIDGRQVLRRTALLGGEPVDAQGRFANGYAMRAASPATLQAFSDELRRQLDHPG
jgi:hypothetical protein